MRVPGLLRGRQPPLFDKALEAQALHQPVELRAVRVIPEVVLRAKFDGHLAEDRGKPVGELRALLPRGELFPEAVANVQLVKIGIDPVHAAVAPHEVEGGLFAHAGHAGDVVGAVAHERLEIDHPPGLKAVFLPEALRGIKDGLRLAHASLDVADRGLVAYKLQAVLVAGDDHAVPALFFTNRGRRAEDVVRLVALPLVTPYAHVVQQLFQQRHLHRELLRHALALGLVALVGSVAEGGRLEVEADAERVRFLLVQQALENGQETVNRVGRRAVRRV